MKNFRPVKKPIPKKIYREIHRLLPIVCTDAVISNGRGSFLMVRRKNRPDIGKWWFPGGRIFKNETLKEAIKRKLKEETGLKPKKIKLLDSYEYFNETGYFSNTNTHAISFVFLAEVSPAAVKAVKLDSQSSEWKWFDKIDPRWHPYLKRFLKESGFK